MEYLLNRLGERSTYISLILLVGIVYLGVTVEQISAWVMILGALGLGGAAIPDGSPIQLRSSPRRINPR